MYQIKIKWDSIIPLFKSVSGIIEIHQIDIELSPRVQEKRKFLTKFRVSCRPGILSYTSMDEKQGIPNDLFEALKPRIETAVKAFQQGVGLEDDMYLWQTEEDYKETVSALKVLFPKEDDYEGA